MSANRRLRTDDVDNCAKLAISWLSRVYLNEQQEWPVCAGSEVASVWGGTIDGLRAWVAATDRERKPPQWLPDLDIHSIADVVRSHQRADGSFFSQELDFAGAETTAWPLAALHEYSNRRDETVDKGLKFLASCVNADGSVSSVPGAYGVQRILPAALTLWAFAKWKHDEDARQRIIGFLIRCQDSNTFGWGVVDNAMPKPGITGYVITAFREAEVPLSQYRKGLDYLLREQRNDGRWPDCWDVWPVHGADETSGGAYPRYLVDGTSYGLTALSGIPERKARIASARAVRYLLKAQTTEAVDGAQPGDIGSWLNTDNGAFRHVWYTSQRLVAVLHWWGQLPGGPVSQEREKAANSAYRVTRWFVEHAQSVMVIGLATIVLVPLTKGPVLHILQWLAVDWSSFRQNLTIAGLVATIGGALGWLFRSLRDWLHR